jgi:hypothetical protein
MLSRAGQRKLHTEELNNLYCSPNIRMKEQHGDMDRTWSKCGREKIAYIILTGET